MKSLPNHNRDIKQVDPTPPRQLKIWAFRAVENPDACHRFLEGHRNVLVNHGVKNVVSANPDWMEDDQVWVVLVESPDGSRSYGGARIHKASQNNRLPIQDAVGYLDPAIDEFIDQHRSSGIGEICGLWNSVEVAGMGVGSVYLIRAGLSLAQSAGITGMFALCSPYTYKMASSFGFFPLREIGNNGKFPYPTEKLIATVTFQEDTEAMNGAHSGEKEIILELRNNPLQQKIETARNGLNVEVRYELII